MVSELEQRILRKLQARGPASPRDIARLLARHGVYREVLRAIDGLVDTGVLQKVPVGYTAVVFVNESNERVHEK